MSEARSWTASADHQVDQPDDGGAVVAVVVISAHFGTAAVFGFGEVDRGVGEFLQHRVSGFTFDLAVVAVDRPLNGGLGGQGGFDLAIEDKPQFFNGFEVERVRDQNPQGSVVFVEWQHTVFAGDRFGDQFDDFFADVSGSQVDVGDLVKFGQRFGDLFGRGVFHLHQNVADIGAGVLGDLFSFGKLIQADDAFLEKQFGEVLHRSSDQERKRVSVSTSLIIFDDAIGD